MDKKKKEALEAIGYKIGSVNEFIGLSEEETSYIEMKLVLGQALAEHRRNKKITQAQLAEKIGSSQSRIAKMEKGDPTVSLDLLVRSLLSMGATKDNIARAISR